MQTALNMKQHSNKFLMTNFYFLAWILIGGISAIGSVVCLGFFSLFAILHVAMQLQRKEIMVSYPRAIFLKGVTASVAGNLGLQAHYQISSHSITKSFTFSDNQFGWDNFGGSRVHHRPQECSIRVTNGSLLLLTGTFTLISFFMKYT